MIHNSTRLSPLAEKRFHPRFQQLKQENGGLDHMHIAHEGEEDAARHRHGCDYT